LDKLNYKTIISKIHEKEIMEKIDFLKEQP
jgi:hypothetical protein